MRLRLDLGYDGSGFRGFAKNLDVDTVEGRLVAALEQVLSHPVSLACAGRTDAGVHARAQVVSFDTDATVDLDRLVRSLNRLCGDEIVVSGAAVVAPDFHARFSALTRRYRYSVLNAPHADPLRRNFVWHVREPLDVDDMNAAAAHFVGLHDFSSFCRRHPNRSTERNVLAAHWDYDSDLLIFDITASSFCHQMVRSLVGTMVEVGRGESKPSDIAGVIAARDRHQATVIAPPGGLCLWDVGY